MPKSSGGAEHHRKEPSVKIVIFLVSSAIGIALAGLWPSPANATPRVSCKCAAIAEATVLGLPNPPPQCLNAGSVTVSASNARDGSCNAEGCNRATCKGLIGQPPSCNTIGITQGSITLTDNSVDCGNAETVTLMAGSIPLASVTMT